MIRQTGTDTVTVEKFTSSTSSNDDGRVVDVGIDAVDRLGAVYDLGALHDWKLALFSESVQTYAG